MSAPPTPDSLLSGSKFKNRSLSFGELGAKPPRWHRDLRVAGPAETHQQTKVGTGERLFWADDGTKTTTPIEGREIWQIVIPVWTTHHDHPEIIAAEGRDNGLRYLWISGSKKPESRSLWAALGQAMAKARAATINEVGAKIDVGFVALGQARTGQSPPRYYDMVWTPVEPGWTPPEEYAPVPAQSTNGYGDVPLPEEPPQDDDPPF